MSVEHSHIINEILDEIRRQVGVVYKEDSRWTFPMFVGRLRPHIGRLVQNCSISIANALDCRLEHKVIDI